MNSMNSDPSVAMSVYRYKRDADIRRAADFRRAADIREARTPTSMTDRTNQPERPWKRWIKVTAAFRVQQ